MVSKALSPRRGTSKRVTSKIDRQLDLFLAERESLVARMKAAATTRDRRVARAQLEYDRAVGDAPLSLAELDAELAKFLERHRYWLTRRHGKTITRLDGEIKEVMRARELDTPASEQPAIDLLLARRGGKRYLNVRYTLNRRRLLSAPAEVRAELSRLGFWWGQHRTLSVKSLSSTAPTQLSRRRYNVRGGK